jgi:hypothetical protein
MRQALLIGLVLLFPFHSAQARTTRSSDPRVTTVAAPRGATDNPALAAKGDALTSQASSDTTWLYSTTFNGSPCNPQGWTSVDLTAQAETFWHARVMTWPSGWRLPPHRPR